MKTRWKAVIAVLLFASSASGQVSFEVLYNFKGGNDAGAPTAAPVLDAEGNLFGTGGGDVYKLTRNIDGSWTETVLQRWYAGTWGGLVADGPGNLYGATMSGGEYNDGIAFELERDANWKALTLYNFGSKENDAGGLVFWAALLRVSGNRFYGAETYPYEIWQRSDGFWQERVLYRFKAAPDGGKPVGTLVSDAQGNLYGATEFGGHTGHNCWSGGGGCGTVYELERQAGGQWKERMVHRFAQFLHDGELPFASPVMDLQGNLYGSTGQGGLGVGKRYGPCPITGCGVIYELSRNSRGGWKEKILYNFCPTSGCPDGTGGGAVAMDAAGNLYGDAGGGNPACYAGCGVIYKLARQANGRWKYEVLHRFDGTDGSAPGGGVTLDGKGHLYGTTFSGGKYYYGVVYELTLP